MEFADSMQLWLNNSLILLQQNVSSGGIFVLNIPMYLLHMIILEYPPKMSELKTNGT